MKTRLARRVILVASGKGGVGKSTVSVNLAVALALSGNRVSLLDTDIYGPSVPIMMGLNAVRPRVSENKKMIPITKFGVQIISPGFFMEAAQGAIWRGPVLHSILEKMITEAEWPDSDYLIVDLPPGTGDVPLSLSQLLSIDGALLVTTPQEVAIADTRRSMNAFVSLSIPLLGVVENMVGFIPDGSEEPQALFGHSKGRDLANAFEIPYFGGVPLIPALSTASDEGVPLTFQQGEGGAGCSFYQLANLLSSLETVSMKQSFKEKVW